MIQTNVIQAWLSKANEHKGTTCTYLLTAHKHEQPQVACESGSSSVFRTAPGGGNGFSLVLIESSFALLKELFSLFDDNLTILVT